MRFKSGKKAIVLVVTVLALAFALVGCDNYSESEEKSPQMSWGDPVEIDYSFNVLDVVKRGPHTIKVVPKGIVTLNVDGKEHDCIEAGITVLSSDDPDLPLYADCTTIISLLSETLGEVANYKWYKDETGAEVEDVKNATMDVGVEYDFYIPLRDSLEESGLRWVTVSDRSNYYARTGTTYWYPVNPE